MIRQRAFFLVFVVCGLLLLGLIEKWTPRPEYGLVFYNLGTDNEAKNMEKASSYYRKAIESNPRILDAYIALGNILLSQGLENKALKMFYSALCSDYYYKPYYHIALVYQKRGNMEKAYEYFLKSLKWNPANKEFVHHLRNHKDKEFLYNFALLNLDINRNKDVQKLLGYLQKLNSFNLADELKGKIEKRTNKR